MKVALFLPNWIGDAVMATPALRARERGFARAEMVSVLRPYVADVLAGWISSIDRLCTTRGAQAAAASRGFLRRLKQEQFDLASFSQSLRSAWLAWRSGPNAASASARDGRRILLTDALPPQPRSVPNPFSTNTCGWPRTWMRRDRPRTEAASCARRARAGPVLEALRSALDCRRRSLSQSGGPSARPSTGHGEFCRPGPPDRRHLGRTVLVLCGPAERDEARRSFIRPARARRQFADFPTASV